MSFVQKFMRLEAAGGFLLMGALVLAILIENSPLQPIYDLLLETPVEIRVGALHIAKPLLLWINDALMAVFFFLVGMELKREVLVGQLSSPSAIILPALAAIAGIAFPSLIYTYFNYNDAEAMQGWAIPAATDIAFALGILALLGSRVPSALKLFLLAVAIIDDIGAIVIIAVFYSGELSYWMFVVAGVTIAGLAFLNWRGVVSATPYVVLGIVLWIAVLKSGVHSTLAGIVLAMFIPLSGQKEGVKPLLVRLEHDLHGTVAFLILPIFAFANAGINFDGMKLSDVTAPVPMGIALGLIVGKQFGIFTTIWLAVQTRLAKLPEGVSWAQIYGLSALCGIGFTMSLFISSLAFEQTGGEYEMNERLGIILGSVVSALLGYLILRLTSPKREQQVVES